MDNIYELKIQSTDSVVRDITYNTSIPNELSSTIAIAAQAPSSVDSLEAVTWNALSKNVINVILHKKTIKTVTFNII